MTVSKRISSGSTSVGRLERGWFSSDPTYVILEEGIDFVRYPTLVYNYLNLVGYTNICDPRNSYSVLHIYRGSVHANCAGFGLEEETTDMILLSVIQINIIV